MPYNLIAERWIPVRLDNGGTASIAPWELTGTEDGRRPVALDAPRPDFNGALIQFLIGLLQTAFPPQNERKWRHYLQNPPEPARLREAFDPYRAAFNLDGDGPRFMQDIHELDADPLPIANLLIDSPTGKTLEDNNDHFVKDRSDWGLSRPAAAMALLTLQLNAPSGGQGHRTSMRGGGPLATVVLADTSQPGIGLWHCAWLNVLTPFELDTTGASREHQQNDADQNPKIFPWLRAVEQQAEEGSSDTPVNQDNVHPLQMYWSMPRRIRLNEPASVTCSVTGSSDIGYAQYVTKNRGINYTWLHQHPLTPYYHSRDTTISPVRTNAERLSYRHWLGLVVSEDGGTQPARVVRKALQRVVYPSARRIVGPHVRLWAFGYDMDNMKARAWRESQMPLYLSQHSEADRADEVRLQEMQNALLVFAAQMVRATDTFVNALHEALRNALYGSYQKKNNRLTWSYAAQADSKTVLRKSLFEDTGNRLWQNTEQDFYLALSNARQVLDAFEGDFFAEEPLRKNCEAWLRTLHKHMFGIFDQVAQTAAFAQADPKSIVLARVELRSPGSPHNKEAREILGLLHKKS